MTSHPRFPAQLTQPVDIASLCALRFLFGSILSIASLRFLAKGWVTQLLVKPELHFSYAPWLTVTPLPPPAMHGLLVVLSLFALGIAVGAFYHWCCLGFLLTFLYLELIDRALYLNHYYLVTLIAWLLLLLPAGRALSVDAWRSPKQSLTQVPLWVVLVLRVQVAVVYLFAGLAKLTPEWLFEAQPLRIWLSARSDCPWVGPWLAAPWLAESAAIAAAAFDLSIVFWLLWPRTQRLALLVLVVFHLATGWLFPIGVFPWLMTALATVLLAPSWPRRFLARISAAGISKVPDSMPRVWSTSTARTTLLGAHCLLQCLLPLRAGLDPINSGWTRRGFDFAWRVMLVEKAGSVEFRARDRNSGETLRVPLNTLFAPFQLNAMAQDPNLIHQAALLVRARYRRQGQDVAVYADAVATMNGRPSQRQINPNIDLTEPLPDDWITPLAIKELNPRPLLER